MRTQRALLFPVLAASLCAAAASAQPQAFDRLLTTNPASDVHPAVSPDGRWLVYTSDRDGAPALIYRDLTTRGVAEEKRVAPHPSKSDDASFSPDGRDIVFTSFRDDALGDVYLMRFPDGTPQSISLRGRVDTQPRFSEDGGAVLFRSATIKGDAQWMKYTRGDGKLEPIDESSAQPPATPFPARSFDARFRAALLYADDTNGDGNLAQGDSPSAWVRANGAWEQASFPIRDAQDIAMNPRTGEILVAARWYDNNDIAVLAQTPLQMGMNADALMQAGAASLEADNPAYDEAIAYFRAGRSAPDATTEQHVSAAIAMMRAMNRAGRAMQVSAEGEALLAQGLGEADAARARLQYYIARSVLEEKRKRDNPNDMSPAEDIEGGLRGALEYFDRSEQVGEAAEAHYQIAVLHANGGRMQEALAETEKVLAVDQARVPEDVICGTILLRAQVFTKLGLGQETEKALTGMFALNPKDKTILEQAADRVIDLAFSRSEKRDERILALRNLASQNEQYPYLVARLKLAEGKLLREIDAFDEAERAWRTAIEQGERALAPATRAALELASMQTARGQYASAVAVARGIEKRLATAEIPGAREAYLTIRTRLIRAYLDKGRNELVLGDHRLAASTFDELIAYDSSLPAAWRGKLRAISGEGDQVNQLIQQFEKEAKAKPQDGLTQYKLGLALSYPDPASERARKAIDRAIAVNSAEPYFHLTRGFIYEQQYRKFSDRGERRNALLEQASLSYEQATMLARADEDPGFVADALLNSANVALSLTQYYKAHTLYQKREASTFGFDDLRTELLFHWNAGVAAFRSSNSRDGAREFQRALDVLDKLGKTTLLKADRIAAIRQELSGRRALAFMEAGDNEEAEKAFRAVYDLSAPASMDRVRALRNRAVIMERMAAQQAGEQQQRTLAEAEAVARQAIGELEVPGLTATRPDETRGGGLINMDILFDSSPVGGARLAFDRKDEGRLLYATLGRVLELQGKREDAIRQLEQQIARDPSLNDTNRAYYLAARSVTLSRIADEWRNTGNNAEALKAAVEGLSLAHFRIDGEDFLNTNSATLFLVQVAELQANEPNMEALRNARSFWMLDAQQVRTARDPWELLDRAAEALSNYPDPAVRAGNPPAVSDPVERARLALVRAMAKEKLAYARSMAAAASTGSPIDALKNSVEVGALLQEAAKHAERVHDLAAEANTTSEVFRLATLASGTQVRVAYLMGGDEAGAKALDAAVTSARETGYGHLSWWLMAQACASAEAAAEQLRVTQLAKEALLSQVVYADRANDKYPELIFGQLEAMELKHALAANDLEGLWSIVDEWRTVRLRWIASLATPPTRSQEEARWLASHDALVVRLRNIQERLRLTSLISTAVRQRTLAQDAEMRSQIAESLEAGWKAGYPSAEQRGLRPLPFSELNALLQPPYFTTKPPRFILRRTLSQGEPLLVVYTAEGARIAGKGSEVDPNALNFVLGDTGDAALPEVVHVLSGRSLLARMSSLTLRTKDFAFQFPVPGIPEERWITDLRLASSLTINDPVQPRNALPALWTVGGSTTTLGDLLESGADLNSVTLSIASDGNGTRDEQRDLAGALLLDAHGVREATIDGDRWLGMVIEPQQAPERAQEELAVLTTRLDRALAANNETETVVSLETIIQLKEALGERSDLQLYYGKLAEQRGRLGRWTEAVEAARRRIDALEKDGADTALRAQGEQQLGDMAANARDWPVCFDAYDKAIDGFKVAGDAKGHASAAEAKAIAFEIAGRFADAIAQSRVARTLLASDVQAAARQDLRIARVQRLYLNDYGAGEATLLSVLRDAERAGLPLLVAEAQINLARNNISLAHFDEAMKQIAVVAKIAEAENSETYRAQAKLESANAHWLRSDYFEAFREEQEVLEIATRTNDMPVEVSVRNIAGLTAWSVNDLKRAYSELNQALDLAEKSGDDAKVASTANNIGLLKRSEKQYDEALDWFRRALLIDTRQGNRWGEAYDLRNTGITLHLAGQSPSAIDPLMRAVALAGEIGDQVNLAKAQLALGDAQAAIQNAQLAGSGYQAALDLAREIPLPEVRWRALHGQGRLALAAGNDKEALALYLEAADIVDSLRASIRIEELQDGFLIDKQGLYDEVVELQLQQGNAAGALESSERARGRNFIDLLGNHRINLGNVTDQNMLDREAELRSRVESLERKVKSDPSVARQLDDARQEYSNHIMYLRAQSPEVASFVRVDAMTAGELQKLIEPDTRMLVYHLLEGGPVCWVVGPESLDAVRLPASRESITERVAVARLKLQNFEPVEEDLQSLANDLIVPTLPYLNGVKRICVVPHQELHTLPFAALSLGGGQDLVDRFAIYYSPSASVLRYTIGRRANRSAEAKTLAVGNPNLGSPQYNLPFAQKEAERLQYDLPNVTVRTGSDATESWLVDNLPNYGIIHIASHGEYNPDQPLFSAIELAPDNANDGRLTSDEVFGLQLRADLIALSACQSGLGRVSKGDDIVGLNRAFVYAGTRQLMTTLWRVDDISTAVLFKYVYRNMRGMDRAEAVRQAQIKLKNRQEYRHPAHWAGLVLSGDWE
ncbi:CHAT domain-containing protein [Candidatus Sumerlaeota bacterium]|nr:CHAT domain-containing protein [Candidatus Sumerlaeota bacterium]